jgi:hypothetical protein
MSDETIELPKHLTTKVEKENIQVSIDIIGEREFKPEEVQRICEAGGIIIDPKRLKSLHDLGFAAEQLGILRTLKGGIVVGLNGVALAVQANNQILEDPDPEKYTTKERLEAGKLAGYLAGQMSKVAKDTVTMDKAVVDTVMNQDKKTRQSFAPGTAVRLNG